MHAKGDGKGPPRNCCPQMESMLMQGAYYTTRILAFGVNLQATEATRSPWPRLASGVQQSNSFTGGFDDFLAWEQQQQLRLLDTDCPPPIANFCLDVQDAAQFLPKHCLEENAYFFLSPGALKSSYALDDPDLSSKSVLDEEYFCDKENEGSPNVSLEPPATKRFCKKIFNPPNQFNLSVIYFT